MADIIVADFGEEHNLKGDSKRTGHEGKLEVLSFSFGASGSYDAYHKRMSADVHTSFNFVTPDGTVTAPLMEASFKTHKVAKATFLVLRREGSEIKEAIKFEFTDCYFDSVSTGMSAGSGAGGDVISVSMVYNELKVTGKGNMEANWKHAEMTA